MIMGVFHLQLRCPQPSKSTSVMSTKVTYLDRALAAATKGVPKLAQLGLETKMYVQDLPSSITDAQVSSCDLSCSFLHLLIRS